jgi:predicted secreted protein
MNAIDVTSKDSNGWKEVLGGLREGSISFEGLLIESEGAGATGYNDLFDLVTSRAAVALEWTNENAGDSKFTCSAIITSLEQEAPMEDARTFSGEFTITGAVTKAVIS